MKNSDLRIARIKHHRTPEGMAKAIGVSYVAYMSWERGYRTPSMKYLDKLMDALEGDVPYELIVRMSTPRPASMKNQERIQAPENMPADRHTLKQLRCMKGLTQVAIADVLGVSLATYSKWEQCRRPVNQNCHKHEKVSQWDRLVKLLGEEPWDTLFIPYIPQHVAHSGPTMLAQPAVSYERETKLLDEGHLPPRKH